LGEWLFFEHDEIHDEDGRLLCPVEGCAVPERVELVGHEYTLGMPGGAGETWCFECEGHRWDLEPWADNSSLVRVFVFDKERLDELIDE
jgi:hypothetical protein